LESFHSLPIPSSLGLELGIISYFQKNILDLTHSFIIMSRRCIFSELAQCLAIRLLIS
jgi:hypothetical protein